MVRYQSEFHIRRQIPRLAQSNVCNTILVAEGYVEFAVSIEGTAVEADVLLESLKEEGSVIDGGFYFARHEDYHIKFDRRRQKLGKGWMAFGWCRYQTTVGLFDQSFPQF